MDRTINQWFVILIILLSITLFIFYTLY
jgi:hypothetical protein